MNATLSSLAPVALFAFNRPDLLAKTLSDLKANPLSPFTKLFVFSDGPRCDKTDETHCVRQVRALVRNINGFQSVVLVERATNLGCRDNVIQGIGQVLQNHDRVIAIEDDLRLSSHFLDYMNAALERYALSDKVWCVNGCCLNKSYLASPLQRNMDAYFLHRNNSYGWGTWRDPWQRINFDAVSQYRNAHAPDNKKRLIDLAGADLPGMLRDAAIGRISSWAVAMTATITMNHGLCLTPVRSYVSSQPTSNGTHVHGQDPRAIHEVSMAKWPINFPNEETVDRTILHEFLNNYQPPRQSLFQRIMDVGSILKWRFTSVLNDSRRSRSD